MKIKLKIKGMHCEHCKMRVEKALGELTGVKNTDVSIKWKKAVIETDEDITDELLREAIQDAGYELIEIKR